MKLIGFVICQDGMPDLLRCLDSLTCCDEIYICDGGSKDGTLEWLHNMKDIYHLKIFERKFDTMQNQRNYLLEQIKEEAWIINIDQDEALNPFGTAFFKDLITKVPDSAYEDGRKEERVLTFEMPYLILINDYLHYCAPYSFLRGKTFFHIPGKIKFWHPYHSVPCYDREEKSQYVVLSIPDRFAIFHYAYFNPKRHEERRKRLKRLLGDEKENEVAWEYDQWFEVERDVQLVPSSFLVW